MIQGALHLPLNTPRFFVATPLAAGATVDLPAPVANHALRVLRLTEDAALTLFNGGGGEYSARLRVANRGRATAIIERHDPVEREARIEATLLQALVAAEKLDWIVEKATELGAARVLLFPAARSVVKLDGERLARRVAHLREIAVAACCQCGRNRMPLIKSASTLDAALDETRDASTRLLLAPDSASGLRGTGGGSVAIAVGPEGGFTPGEMQTAQRSGFAPARLGRRVLRTETAGPAALAALLALAGEFA